jgi:hypothetical protein
MILSELKVIGSLPASSVCSHSHFTREIPFLSTHLNHTHYNSIRSAEFVVYPQNTKHISTEYIHRIITFDSDKVPLDALTFENNRIHTICDDPTIDVFKDPLDKDKKFWNNIKKLMTDKKLKAAYDDLLRVEAKIDRSLHEDFDQERIALGVHGVGHVTRVMFWVILLAHLAREKGYAVSNDNMEAAVFAAYIHDLCRINNSEDDKHGETAAKKFTDWLGRKLPQEEQQRSCLQAITYHCRVDVPEYPDVVWQLLKDADALDRGRFKPPGIEDGCDIARLTHSMFQNKLLAEKCAWTAFQLAGMTKYTKWESSTVSSLLEMLQQSRKLTEQEYNERYIYTSVENMEPF